MRHPTLILLVVAALCLCAPLVAPADPMRTDSAVQLQPPDLQHLLGTDLLGRDVLSRVLYGGGRSLVVMAISACIAVLLGTAWGVLLGLITAWTGSILMVITNALIAIPGMLIALVVLTVFGGGLVPLAVAVGTAQIMPVALVTRSAIRSVLAEEYYLATESLGASPYWALIHHILPNIQMILFSYAAVTSGYCLLNSSALAFLGLGGEPGVPDWGVMLADGRSAFRSAPWIGAAPGLLIALVVWALNAFARSLGKISRR